MSDNNNSDNGSVEEMHKSIQEVKEGERAIRQQFDLSFPIIEANTEEILLLKKGQRNADAMQNEMDERLERLEGRQVILYRVLTLSVAVLLLLNIWVRITI